MTSPVKSWADRLLGLALTVLLSAWALHWAWRLLRPLLPVLALGAVLFLIGRLVLTRHRTW